MGDSRRPTPSHRLNAYCTVIVRVNYGYGYTRRSGRVWVEIFGVGRVRVRVASSATGTGRVAEMVDPHTPNRVSIPGLLFPGHPEIPVIFHSRIPGNGSASFPAKTGTVQLTALLSFAIIAACSRDAPLPLQRFTDESLLDAVSPVMSCCN